MSDKRCFICGFGNDHALERHHIIPESLNGEDSEENTVWLCANCHRAVSTIYSKWFFARLWHKFNEMDKPPKLVRKKPPNGLKYNDDHELEPDYDDGFEEIIKGIRMYERGKTYREIIEKTGLSMGKIQQLKNQKEVYKSLADGEGVENEKLFHFNESDDD